MRFISIDLELNQPSNKIIQVGAASFDTDVGRLGSYSAYVDPGEVINWNHKLNIGITLEELLPTGFKKEWENGAGDHDIVLREFWEWFKNQQCGKKIIQWGKGDLEILLQESQGLGYPSHLKVLDLKQVYKFLWQPSARLEAQSGLTSACINMNTYKPIPPHDAYYDAKATGLIFMKMFKQLKATNNFIESIKD